MKKILFLLFCVLSLTVSSQTILEKEQSMLLLSEGKCWTMNYKLAVAPEYGDVCNIEETILKGDTVIYGIHCMQKYKRECRQGEEMPETWKKCGYIGQEGSKVYKYNEYTKMLNIIMDFSLNEGDVIKLPDEGVTLQATAVSDTIIANSSDNRPRKCIYLQLEGSDIEADVWVEGIGSLIYGITGQNIMYSGSYPQLESCVENGSVLYSRTDSVNSVSKVTITDHHDKSMYDLQGRRMETSNFKFQISKLNRGVYIRDGRKVVVK